MKCGQNEELSAYYHIKAIIIAPSNNKAHQQVYRAINTGSLCLFETLMTILNALRIIFFGLGWMELKAKPVVVLKIEVYIPSTYIYLL